MTKLHDIKIRKTKFDRDFFYLNLEFEKPNGLIEKETIHLIKGQDKKQVSLILQGLVNILEKKD